MPMLIYSVSEGFQAKRYPEIIALYPYFSLDTLLKNSESSCSTKFQEII